MNIRSSRFLIITSLLVLSSILCSPPEGGVIEGSGHVITRQERVDNFTRIEAGNGVDRLSIEQGESHQVTLNIDPNFTPYLHAQTWGDKLAIYLEENRMAGYVGEFRVEIVTPLLEELILLANIETTMRGFDPMEDFSASVYSSGKLEAEMDVSVLQLQAFTHSEITLSGSAENVNIRAGYSSQVDLSNMDVGFATVEARENSTVILHVRDQLDVFVEVNSAVFYSGDPSITNFESDETSIIESLD